MYIHAVITNKRMIHKVSNEKYWAHCTEFHAFKKRTNGDKSPHVWRLSTLLMAYRIHDFHMCVVTEFF